MNESVSEWENEGVNDASFTAENVHLNEIFSADFWIFLIVLN